MSHQNWMWESWKCRQTGMKGKNLNVDKPPGLATTLVRSCSRLQMEVIRPQGERSSDEKFQVARHPFVFRLRVVIDSVRKCALVMMRMKTPRKDEEGLAHPSPSDPIHHPSQSIVVVYRPCLCVCVLCVARGYFFRHVFLLFSLSLSLSLAIFSPFFTFIFFPHLFAGLANEAWCTRVGRIGRRGRESVYLRVEHTTVHYNRAWRNSLWLTSTEIRSSLIFLSLFLVAVSLVFFVNLFKWMMNWSDLPFHPQCRFISCHDGDWEKWRYITTTTVWKRLLIYLVRLAQLSLIPCLPHFPRGIYSARYLTKCKLCCSALETLPLRHQN